MLSRRLVQQLLSRSVPPPLAPACPPPLHCRNPRGAFASHLARSLCAAANAPTLSLTERCAGRINRLNAQHADNSSPERLLRVSVEPGGCSGFQYAFTLQDATSVAEDDSVFERAGAKVVVDECSLELLRGATVDFEDDMMRAAFVISDNPVADASCGCGSSFQAKEL